MENQTIEEAYRAIYNPLSKFNDNYGLSYVEYPTYELLLKSLDTLFRAGELNRGTVKTIRNIYKHWYSNSIKIKELDATQPRTIAQKFIGKKNIRHYIFKRDGNKCLKCGATNKLTLDHINPISKGGENRLINLQTLCRSCNSAKGTTFKDYRNGRR